MSSPSIPPSTDRQALVRLANLLTTMAESADGDASLVFDTAVAAIMGALVSRGADYTYGTLGAATLTRDGRVRVGSPELAALEAILAELKGLRQELQLHTGVIGD